MRAPRWLVLLAVGGVAGLVAHGSHRRSDGIRSTADLDERARLLPDPSMIHVAAMGYDLLVADLFWVRTVLTFSDMVDGKVEGSNPWLEGMLETVIELDPYWRTAWFYGGGMLRVVGDIDGSDRVYRRAMDYLPDDPFFPFSLAMNAYLYRQDNDRAFFYLDRAASMPGAPRWYRAAAAAFLDEHGQRLTAIRYLEDQMKADDRPEVVAAVMPRYQILVHDELADGIELRRSEWERDHGHALTDLAVLGDLPEDPFGEGWILAPDGRVRSARRDRSAAAEARAKERRLLLAPGRAAAGAPGP